MGYQKAWLLSLALTAYLYAGPEGLSIKAGHAIQKGATIHSQGPTVIEWNSFSIDKGEHIQFLQADPSCVLNRVMGGQQSHILGQLSSNGQLILINPQGVVIGRDASINTAGFMASTLDLIDAQFLAGQELLFSGNSESAVINLGKIESPTGDILLLGRVVKNQGELIAPQGHVCLGGASQILLKPEGSQRIFIQPSDSGTIEQSGTIEALTVELRSNGNPYLKAIQCSGVIEASAFEERDGEIFLVAEEGICEVDGSLRANTIHVLGQEILVGEHSYIDVSGANGGGTILVGGDYQGQNPEIPNAKRLAVAPGAVFNADALEKGDGGKVILWSDEETLYHGFISFRGGPGGGDGGFAEVSGHYLDFKGMANGGAPLGKAGTLLLDPTDIIISAAADSGGSFSGCMGGTNTFTPSAAATNTINTTTLVGLLDAPCNVTISTVGSSGAGPNNGSISVSAAVVWTEATTLTLHANSFLLVTQAITNSSASMGFDAIVLVADGTSAGNNSGIFLSTANSILTTDGGTIRIFGSSSNTASSGSAGGVRIDSRVVTNAGDIYIAGNVPSGTTSLRGIILGSLSNFIESASGNIFVSAANASGGTATSGVDIATAWNPTTTGTVTFGATISNPIPAALPASISGCTGGSGTLAHGILMRAAFSAQGNVVATNQIQGGTGSGSVGFLASASFGSVAGRIFRDFSGPRLPP